MYNKLCNTNTMIFYGILLYSFAVSKESLHLAIKNK